MLQTIEEKAVKSIAARRRGTVWATLFAGMIAVAATQAWSPDLIGDGLAPTDDPDSPYFHSTVAPPPSWQGRPYAIPNRGSQPRFLM